MQYSLLGYGWWFCILPVSRYHLPSNFSEDFVKYICDQHQITGNKNVL